LVGDGTFGGTVGLANPSELTSRALHASDGRALAPVALGRRSYFADAVYPLLLHGRAQGLYLISSNNKEDIWIAKFPFDAF